MHFRSGRYTRNWVGNVVAIGNANGFVEPLEATAIAVIVYAAQALVEMLREGNVTPGVRATYNRLIADVWTETRDFLALHYRFNSRLDTPFWEMCRAETPLGTSMLARHHLGHHDNIFGLEGHLALLIGQQVPHAGRHHPSAEELARWRNHCADYDGQARAGCTVREALQLTRHPAWRWS